MGAGINPWPGISTTEESGTLRLTRDATGIRAYYGKPSNWILIYNWPASTPNYYSGDVQFGFSVWNGYDAQTGMQIAFDNFYLNAPNWSGPGTPVPLPSTVMLLISGLAVLIRARRYKN